MDSLLRVFYLLKRSNTPDCVPGTGRRSPPDADTLPPLNARVRKAETVVFVLDEADCLQVSLGRLGDRRGLDDAGASLLGGAEREKSCRTPHKLNKYRASPILSRAQPGPHAARSARIHGAVSGNVACQRPEAQSAALGGEVGGEEVVGTDWACAVGAGQRRTATRSGRRMVTRRQDLVRMEANLRGCARGAQWNITWEGDGVSRGRGHLFFTFPCSRCQRRSGAPWS